MIMDYTDDEKWALISMNISQLHQASLERTNRWQLSRHEYLTRAYRIYQMLEDMPDEWFNQGY